MHDIVTDNLAATFERLLDGRFSCRAFRPDPVPRYIVESILRLAQRTASWNNTQPWQVIITSGAATDAFRNALYAKAKDLPPPEADFPFPREYRGVYRERRRECGFQLYDAVGIQRGDKAAYTRQALENFRFFGAPHVAIVSSDEALGPYGAVDCGAYVSNFMLAAQAHGVASIAQAAVTQYGALVHEHFNIPNDRMLICGVAFGYADMRHPLNNYRTSRSAIGDVADFRQ